MRPRIRYFWSSAAKKNDHRKTAALTKIYKCSFIWSCAICRPHWACAQHITQFCKQIYNIMCSHLLNTLYAYRIEYTDWMAPVFYDELLICRYGWPVFGHIRSKRAKKHTHSYFSFSFYSMCVRHTVCRIRTYIVFWRESEREKTRERNKTEIINHHHWDRSLFSHYIQSARKPHNKSFNATNFTRSINLNKKLFAEYFNFFQTNRNFFVTNEK